MKNTKLIQSIQKSALIDEKNRTDLRYLKTMAFLTHKGFLKSDLDFEKNYFTKIKYADAVWSGKNVEPRILEVLPAAIARLPKSFIFRNNEFLNLTLLISELKKSIQSDILFHDIPFNKLKIWMNLKLTDQRTKTIKNKKITKTFRLNTESIAKLKSESLKRHITETEIVENLLSQI